MGGQDTMGEKKYHANQRDELYELYKRLVIMKCHQRAIEDRLLQTLGHPMQRKWMHERIQDQYKHDKIIREIVEKYLERKMLLDPMKRQSEMKTSITHELNTRLEGVRQNIQVINHISQLIEDFKVYKVTTSMLNDEYIYQERLIKTLRER